MLLEIIALTVGIAMLNKNILLPGMVPPQKHYAVTANCEVIVWTVALRWRYNYYFIWPGGAMFKCHYKSMGPHSLALHPYITISYAFITFLSKLNVFKSK